MTLRNLMMLGLSSCCLGGCVGYRTPLDPGMVADAHVTGSGSGDGGVVGAGGTTGAGGAAGSDARPGGPPQPPLRDYPPTEVQAALAQCNLAHGPVVSPATFGDKRALMVGAWIACPPSVETVYSPAIVFAADGTFNRLLSDGNGGLVPGYGVENQGSYDFPFPDKQPTNGNSYVTVAAASADFRPAQFGDGPMTLEASPSRIHAIITYMDQTIEVWLVKLF